MSVRGTPSSRPLSVGEARSYILDSLGPLPPETVPIVAALGCVVAEAVVAAVAIPSFANSAMDGYALHAADTSGAPVRLKIVGIARAGKATTSTIGRGETVRIMTGAPMPASADAVCVVERTRLEAGGEVVVIESPVSEGANVRLPGEDVTVGQEVLHPGTVLSAAHLGVLAGLGKDAVTVHRRPRVGVLSTGDELVESPEPLGADKIRDANRPLFLALLRQAGFTAVDLGVVGDDEDAIAAALVEGAAGCDALLTTGGVSVGDTDLLKVALEKLSAGAMRSMNVAVRPAKRLAYGILAATSTPVFGLSGNPAAAVVGYELFARPALRKMAGHRQLDRPVVRGVAEVALPRRRDGKLHLVRVTATGGPDGLTRVRPSRSQNSHLLLSLAEANAFALVPDGEGVPAGGPIDVMLLEWESVAWWWTSFRWE
jgi:molybdenum cofactor synthesis domain-containing protein